jgi:hypothetical protein
MENDTITANSPLPCDIEKLCAGYITNTCTFNIEPSSYMGARGSVMVKALCYKPEGRVFDIR